MNGRQGQPVGVDQPEKSHRQQHQSQHSDFRRGNGEHVADEIFVVFGEAAAAQSCHKNPQSHRRAGKYADEGVCRLIGAAAHIGKHQGEAHAEAHSRPGGRTQAADGSDGNAGKGRVTQGIGEEAHPAGDDHGGQEAEQGSHEQHGEKGVFHKVPVEHFQGEQVTEAVPKAHKLPPFMWKAWANSGELRTSWAVP